MTKPITIATPLILVLVLGLPPFEPATAETPLTELEKAFKENRFGDALSLLQEDLKRLDASDLPRRAALLASMTVATLARSTDLFEVPVNGTNREEKVQAVVGLETLDELVGFEPLWALICLGLSTFERDRWLRATYDYDPDVDEVECLVVEASGAEAPSKEVRYHLATALFTTGAVLWDGASRHPLRYMEARNVYSVGLRLRELALSILKDPVDSKEESVVDSIISSLVCRPDSRTEQMQRELIAKQQKENEEQKAKGHARGAVRAAGQLLYEGRRMATVDFT